MSDLYPVNAEFAAQSRIDRDQYQRAYRESIEQPEKFWGKAAERLDWIRTPARSKDVSYAL